MKTFKQFIEKSFVDLKPKKNKKHTLKAKDFGGISSGKDLSQELFDLIEPTYRSIGGHANIKSPKDIPGKKIDNWFAVDIDDDPEPDIVIGTKNKKGGSKSVVSASDGSPEAKKAMVKIKADELKTKGHFAEVSGGIAHVLIKYHNSPFVDNKEDVEKVLGKQIEWVGENPNGVYPTHKGWYNRKIGGESHMKIMLGKPKL